MFSTSRRSAHVSDWMLLVLLGFFVVRLSNGTAADGSEQVRQLEKLIAQLGSPRYTVRHKATRALEILGPVVLPDLAKATKSPDPEIRRQAVLLIEVISRRAETEKLLAGTQVELKYRDVSIADVVADLSRKTGFPLALDVDRKKLGRKITLDAGRAPFWKALDLFCAKASLGERGYSQVTEKNRVPATSSSPTARAAFKLFLVEAVAPPPSASYYLGARVRVLPPATPLSDLPRAIDERVIALEICLDPGRPLHNILGLRIDKAVDAGGANVRTSPQLVRDKKPETTLYRQRLYDSGVVSLPSHVSRLERGMDEGNFRRALLRVRATKLLKELEGVLTVEVQKPSGPVFVVDNILKVAGKSFTTPDGGSLTVNGATLKSNGQVHIAVDTSFPLGGRFGGIRMGNGVVRIRRVANGEWETIGLKMENLKLLDKEGRAYEGSVSRNNGMRFGPAGLTQTMSLTFTPRKGQTTPAKLVYYGEPTTFVDIPFKLKDVPLP